MSFPPGARLGPYEITSSIGAGGMGEVYRARDTRLDRAVAIKVLPAALAGDPQFRARFDREARAISALEHPNICALYDVGKSGATDYLVMQLVDGETLGDRLSKGALPFQEAVNYAIAIASALDHAHTNGIVHRDLKPGNIMLARASRSGAAQVKLLDFGLAKGIADALQPSGVADVTAPAMTRTSPLTAEGAIVGTFQYMAPEQIEGQDADTRSDIWAFGCVLYEMLTGTRAFEGRSRASLIGAIMKDEPPRIAATQPLTPAAIDHVVSRCLAKNPDDRWQHIRDVRNELAWIAQAPSEATALGTDARPARSGWRTAALLTAAAIGGAVLALAIGWGLFADRTPPRLAKFTVTAPGDPTPSGDAPVLSRDGSRVAFVAVSGGQARLYLRALDQSDAVAVAGSEGASAPFFSPDGAWVGFFSAGELKKVSLTGGQIVSLARAREPRGGVWTGDGRIVFAPGAYTPLFAVPEEGGAPQPLTTLDPARQEQSHRYPHVLPDGRIAFSILTEDPLHPMIGAVPAGGGSHAVVVDRAYMPRYARGHLFFAEAGTLRAGGPDAPQASSVRAVPFSGGRATGAPVLAVPNIASLQVWGRASYDVAENGTFIGIPAFQAPVRRLIVIDGRGASTPLPFPPQRYRMPRLSPDGLSLAVAIGDDDSGLWIADLRRGVLDRLALPVEWAGVPVWSPDGREIVASAIESGRPSLLRFQVSNPGAVRRMSLPVAVTPTSWHPTQPVVLAESLAMTTRTDVLAISLEDGRRQSILSTEVAEGEAQFSPDGAWMLYHSGPSLYLQRYPASGRPTLVSPVGRGAVWRRDGREFYFQSGRTVMGSTFSPSDGLVGTPRAMFEQQGILSDVLPDGRFLFSITDEATVQRPSVVLTLGALDEVFRRGRR